MKVTVTDRRSNDRGYHGFRLRTIEIADTCPKCGGPRGEPVMRWYCEDGEWFGVSRWENPCSHIDTYNAVLREAEA